MSVTNAEIDRIELDPNVKTTRDAGLRFLIPGTCPMCGEFTELVQAIDKPRFCQQCFESLVEQESEACFRCGQSIGPYLDPRQKCSRCKGARPAFSEVVRFGEYDGELQRACINAKAAFRYRLASAIAQLLWQRNRERLEHRDIDLVISVPHYWAQRFNKPHNAAESMARVLADCLKAQFSPRILAKSRWTPDQSSLTGIERRQNLTGAYSVKQPQLVAGRRILLVDDIMTTGTTAQEAAKTLKQSGAKQIIVATAAVVS